jgi:hypothetical protein
VIERDRYELGAWQFNETGACKSCGTQIPGVFAGSPGARGTRRLVFGRVTRGGAALAHFCSDK